ncbi:lanthionine synthetase LanC family protein [Nocardioides sp.]|uniref:lanthionine synthetase LanC family protein n=1 Tax=Nocardioides sp. TaxID=35761 RepID=UPI002F403F98
MAHEPAVYRDLAERSWSWVLTQVRANDDGLWLPENPEQAEPGEHPYGLHSGVGGLAHVLSEVGLTRELGSQELLLADGIAETLVQRIAEETEYDYFDGLTSTLGVLTALGAPGSELAVARLTELATPDGWQPSWLGPPRAVPEGRCNDVTLGTAAVLLGAVWALRYGVPGAAELADHAADVLLAEKLEVSTGLDWRFVPDRFVLEPRSQMPNWSHGLAGIAGSLAAAGMALARPDLVDAARLGAEHLVTLADTSDGGMRVPHVVPVHEDLDTFTYSWCHGPAGTSLLFAGLAGAGVPEVAGRTPYDWERACLRSLRLSGIPERVSPGFWDNDGRCCGTAGVGDIVLNVWQRHGLDDDLAFAVTLGEALVERSINDGDHAYWRFVEHRNEDPLNPPGPGWMQGAAGIAAYLFRLARLLDQGRDAEAVARMDTWWA